MIILILTIVAVCGAITVALGKPLVANVLWLFSNPSMAIYNYKIGEFEMAGMFAVYSIIAIYGVYNLKIRGMLRLLH